MISDELRSASASIVSDTFSAEVDPVLTVAPGERFVVATRSILSHVDSTEFAAFEELDDYAHMNIPVTGPIAISGLRRGDVVRIDVHEIAVAEVGAMITIPGRGGVDAVLKPRGRLVNVEPAHVVFKDIRLPIRPMIGKIGLADPAAPHCSTVGAHGGNMDCTDLIAGSSLFLRARYDEGLLFVGDLHARQADGETSLTGVEVEGTVTLSCHVLPGVDLNRPVLVSGDQLITIGDGDDLDEAVQHAQNDMHALVMAAHDWSAEDAAMLMSIGADIGICQVVNPRRSAKVSIPLQWCRLEPFTRSAGRPEPLSH